MESYINADYDMHGKKNNGDIDHVLTAIEAMMGATKTSTLATRQ